MLEANEFQCANCGGIFEKEWSDEEAEMEQKDNFPGIPLSECSLVCEDCYQELIAKGKAIRDCNNCKNIGESCLFCSDVTHNNFCPK